MTFSLKPAVAGVLVLSLAACGGGVGEVEPGSRVGTVNPPLPTFGGAGSGAFSVDELNQIAPAVDAFVDSAERVNLPPTVRTSGTAQYNGITFARFADDTEALGNLTIDADFGAGSISGTANDFVHYDVSSGRSEIEPLAGALPITNGAISGNNVTADLRGTLTGAAGNFAVNTTLDGDFVRYQGDNTVIGSVNGNVTTPGGAINVITEGTFLGVE